MYIINHSIYKHTISNNRELHKETKTEQKIEISYRRFLAENGWKAVIVQAMTKKGYPSSLLMADYKCKELQKLSDIAKTINHVYCYFNHPVIGLTPFNTSFVIFMIFIPEILYSYNVQGNYKCIACTYHGHQSHGNLWNVVQIPPRTK